MPDLREVYEMVKQQTQPDMDSWAEQERRIRRAGRNRKVGAFALVAAIAVAAFVFVMYDPGDDQGAAVPATDPESPAPVVERGFAQYDLATGELTYTGIVASSSAVDVSPDATKIAYVDSSNGTGSTVHIANVDGSNVQEFGRTNAAGEAAAPRWSPDGTKIVYQGKPTNQEIGNLYVLDVTTGRAERITDLESMEAGIWWMGPTFSFDGQTVYFSKPRIAGIGDSDAGQHWDIWSVPASGGEPTLIRRDAQMADLSPDGNSLAYLEAKSGDGGFATGGLYMARPDGTDARKLANGPADLPRWSPDGTRIAYSGDVDGIHIIAVETGETQRYPDAVGWTEWVDADTLMIEVGVD
jgi:Tol biopolymer transport system component